MKATYERAEAASLPDFALSTFMLQLNLATANKQQAQAILQQQIQAAEQGLVGPRFAALNAVVMGDFDTAGRLLLLADERKDGTWTVPVYIILPEQAPDSEPWQTFWRLPGPSRFAQKRRENGLGLHPTGFGEARQ